MKVPPVNKLSSRLQPCFMQEPGIDLNAPSRIHHFEENRVDCIDIPIPVLRILRGSMDMSYPQSHFAIQLKVAHVILGPDESLQVHPVIGDVCIIQT
jgi:hypothetical protein